MKYSYSTRETYPENKTIVIYTLRSVLIFKQLLIQISLFKQLLIQVSYMFHLYSRQEASFRSLLDVISKSGSLLAAVGALIVECNLKSIIYKTKVHLLASTSSELTFFNAASNWPITSLFCIISALRKKKKESIIIIWLTIINLLSMMVYMKLISKAFVWEKKKKKRRKTCILKFLLEKTDRIGTFQLQFSVKTYL